MDEAFVTRGAVRRGLRVVVGLSLVAASLCVGPAALAVDTTETWDAGAFDVDFYVGLDSVGRARDEHILSSDLMIGYGLIERFSAYVGTALAIEDRFSSGGGELSLGLFGTPLDTDHVDLDLFLDVTGGGQALSQILVTPALELNVDLLPELRQWGVYLQIGVAIARTVESNEASGASPRTEATVETVIGTYVTIAERHQLLVDFEAGFRTSTASGEPVVEVGSIGVGYNVVVHEAIELVTEVRFDVPQRREGDTFAVGFMAGAIATLPTGRRDVADPDVELTEAGD